MHRRVKLAIAVTSVAAVLGVAVLDVSASGPKLAGTWAGSYSGASTGTFTLHWTQSGSSLIGSITLSNPRGKFPITGNVRGSSIKFGTVAGGGVTYSGSVSSSGTSMTGKWKSGAAAGSWTAHKKS